MKLSVPANCRNKTVPFPFKLWAQTDSSEAYVTMMFSELRLSVVFYLDSTGICTMTTDIKPAEDL